MKTEARVNLDKVGAVASAVCAVHCLLTGVALGLLSVAGLGFFGNIWTDIAFLAVAVAVGSLAVIHGIRKHHSYKPALIFVSGLAFIVLGHFVFRHVHAGGAEPWDFNRVMSVVCSVAGGLCLVLFHVVNLRLQRSCGCKHCATGH